MTYVCCGLDVLNFAVVTPRAAFLKNAAIGMIVSFITN